MLDAYRTVFAHRGAFAFSATGVVARMPMSMMTLGIVLLVTATNGSYAQGGQLSAAYIIGNAVVAVPHGRLTDRLGQTAVLYLDAVLFAPATGLMVYAVTHHWPAPWPHVLAALSGAALPQIGSMVRARWAHLVTNSTERHTAFAVEAVGDEVVFITGPVLVGILATAYAPRAGLLAALSMGTIGALVLAAQRSTAPSAHRPRSGGPATPMPWRRLTPVAAATVALGGLFAALEVGTVAVSSGMGHRSSAGVLLAAFALGSMVSGVVAGAIRWSTPDHRRFQFGIAALATAMLAMPFLHNIGVLGVGLFVVGTALAPSLIAVTSFLEAITPRERLTEAMALFQTGISAGVAPGAWGAGVVADHLSGSSTYWVCVVSAGLALTGSLWFRPAPSANEHNGQVEPQVAEQLRERQVHAVDRRGALGVDADGLIE